MGDTLPTTFDELGIGENTKEYTLEQEDIIRNVDLQLERLIGEVASGRDSAVQEIRGEIRLLARTIAAIAEETE